MAAPALEVRLWTEEADGQDAERGTAGLGADTIVQAVVQPADAEYESATVPIAAPEAEDGELGRPERAAISPAGGTTQRFDH